MYALRIIRDVGTKAITVMSPKQCRTDQVPYVKRTPGVCVEVLRVFKTHSEAAAAEKEEQYAAELATKSTEELSSIAHEEFQYLNKELGISARTIADISGLSIETLRKCAAGAFAYNPRAIARMHFAAVRFRGTIRAVKKLLPMEESTGNLSKARRSN